MNDTDIFGEIVSKRAAMGSHHAPASSTGTDEWLTPPELLRSLGTFDLDPCSPGSRRPWDTAKKHYSAEDNGMRQPWSGRVWLNPPYSNARAWLTRLAEHGQGTALVFARTETHTWHEVIWPRATAVLFLHGRLTFHYIDGTRAKANSGAPSALVAFGDHDGDVLRDALIGGQYIDLRLQRGVR